MCVVLASGGYPGKFDVGFPITGIENAESTGATVFHAGTRIQNGQLVNSSGRVLGVTVSGPDLPSAIDRAYAAVFQIQYENIQFRKDIGRKGLRRYNIP